MSARSATSAFAKRARPWLFGSLGLLSACAVRQAAPDRFAAIDSCLQSGGAWNYRGALCQPVPPGPVDRIVVDKSAHWMVAYRGNQIVREFQVALGRGGLAPKQQQGDGRVPEGIYRITAHNAASGYHLSLRIGYPTAQQVAAARAAGINPGGDIMIHGLPNDESGVGSRHTQYDWTDGCIAVTDQEMDWLYRAVRNGTPVEIDA